MSEQIFEHDQEITVNGEVFVITGVQYDENPETHERSNYTYFIKTHKDVETLLAKQKEQE